ncbi:OLC1v1021502C2 [Oldenlandia corymbosa var. corymbosa]|uniref:OLC1v1021502C2 n=1 Tax=Oldenlandia corymbosa var. corymbosa TaxID=529605 RepID=A0AAV1BY30_OLDCO|nr:OLC1v1021502C2 [Oldenlandia corymbosa var. corymbosa]
MEQNPNSSSSKADRKTIEKNRRNQMKTLLTQLNSLVPHQSNKEALSLPDRIGEAISYIKTKQIRLEELKEKRDSLIEPKKSKNVMGSLREPHVDVQEMGSALQVVLITGSDCRFMFREAIRVLHEEGAQVVNASFYVAGDTIFHTLHSKLQG